jgi:hypothetical protein
MMNTGLQHVGPQWTQPLPPAAFQGTREGSASLGGGLPEAGFVGVTLCDSLVHSCDERERWQLPHQVFVSQVCRAAIKFQVVTEAPSWDMKHGMLYTCCCQSSSRRFQGIHCMSGVHCPEVSAVRYSKTGSAAHSCAGLVNSGARG